ncbi:hypothetical protein FPQ18DRAFT_279072 [Pyronema domesticum]|uniref:Aminomethyltransferase n=1 Tax=Pyronema omphalodes (strain CBS 100304) TaxID=1076935 RepID=U4KX57_PYROM|nr:hypothetical protein FPQ18DRAFT_279072 [Pyronema domesticum]CCX06582.1 Similar to Probable aminomethyltransferase, mitochondrial; acc. no. O14110 [Pyronema omphalodes CBS 100304]
MLPRTLRLTCARTALPRTTTKSVFTIAVRKYTSPAGVPPVELKKTPLHDLHVAAGAKMVPFAGYSMPVTYADQGLAESHKHVRTKAGLFDVSHMVQHRFTGPAALPFLQSLTPSDLSKLLPNTSTLSCFLHPVTGGIVDDLMITLHGPEDFYVVSNAACAEKDLAYISENLSSFPRRSEVEHTVLDGQGLIALQGPESMLILNEFLLHCLGDTASCPDLKKFLFGQTMFVDSPYGKLHVARGGYTGEDGFEISIPKEHTVAVTKELLEIGKGDRVKLAGLGARDTLRLEAGMCLYGHDLDDSTTPIEAGLKWLVGKDRVAEGGFHGHETISRQYADWKQVPRRRVGFTIEKGAPAREGAEIVDPATGEVLGKITSGCPSPTLGTNIAMGYIKSGFHKAGTEVAVKVRGKTRQATVAKMPFVKANYWKGE